MAWDVTVSFDEDKTDVGTVTAVFTDTDLTVFSFSARIQSTIAARNAFCAAAVAARDLWKTKKTANAAAVTSVKARFTAIGEVVT